MRRRRPAHPQLLQHQRQLPINRRRRHGARRHVARVVGRLGEAQQDAPRVGLGDADLGAAVVAEHRLDRLRQALGVDLAARQPIGQLPGRRPAGVGRVGEAVRRQLIFGVKERLGACGVAGRGRARLGGDRRVERRRLARPIDALQAEPPKAVRRRSGGEVDEDAIRQPARDNVGGVEETAVRCGDRSDFLLVGVAPRLGEGDLQRAPARPQRARPLHFDDQVLGEVAGDDDVGVADLVHEIAFVPIEHLREQVLDDRLGDLLALGAVP